MNTVTDDNGVVVDNQAFKDDVRDMDGKIEGKIAASAKLPQSVSARLNRAATNRKAGEPIPFVTVYQPLQAELILSRMLDDRVNSYMPSPQSRVFTQILLPLMIPVLLIVALWVLFVRQVQSSGNKAMSFGKSRAKLISEGQVKVLFEDVAGVDEAKEELCEVVDFLKDPKKFSRLGGRIPKGVLLFGPPGTGKTMLAKAVAGEANVPFFSISGSDFVEMFVGVGASRVRDLFEQAKKSKPCLVFIDEIDAVGRHRFAGIGGGHDEREQTLNQLLVEMDGFATNEGVILIAATNRPDVLDPALLRPGRFDRQIAVDYPDVLGREKILKVHAKNVKLANNVDMLAIAKGTPGYSGADLANIINEAALLAARQNKPEIDQRDLEEAKDRVMMGPERRSMKITENEKHATAVHEGGHAIVARFTEGSDPVHKITIIPRGRALGVTHFLPAEEKHSHTRTELKAKLVAMLGGMAAEQIVFAETGTGVGNDLHRVTDLARRMVCEFGMSERLGPRTFGESRGQVFVGRDMNSDNRDYSEEVAQIIDDEVRSLVEEAHTRAVDILTEKRELLDKLTQALIDRETIDAEEFEMLIRGEDLPPLFKKGDDTPPGAPPEQDSGKEKKKAKPPRIGDFLDKPRHVPG
ncbi:ATP-dependent zinc metalloprotease FtsH [bacterium]|nr:ATP-dependent zinc metalloprotease FtsH [bacterium]